MPRFAVVIKDPARAQAAEIARSVEFHAQARPDLPRRLVFVRVSSSVGDPRPVGTVHGIYDSECPDGLPNCRNCGDPAHAEECKAAGHCPLCGTAHGLAPDSVIASSGCELVEQ